MSNNPIFIQRTKNKGIIEINTALNCSITGVNLRASGMSLDFRTKDSLYKDFEVNPVVLDDKDAFGRYKARILELQSSIDIIKQALSIINKTSNLEQKLVNPINLKLPAGEYFAETEAPRGLASCYIKSTGENTPYRLKWRTPSYYSVNFLRKLLKNEYINDAIAIAGSLDIILPEVDK
ncbi:hypothetical protein IJO12_04720 [bacterium]|nr:hypothetical protein [bacterium]